MKHLDIITKNAVRLFSEALSRQHYPLFGLLLFGSRARHTQHTESDADVAVLLDGEPKNFIATKLMLDDIAYDILLETGMRIQPLPIWKSEWQHPDKYRNPRLLENIRREGISL